MPWVVAFFLLATNSPVLTAHFNIVEAAPLTKMDLVAIATSSAERYHLTKKQTARMLATIGCESNWDVNALSKTHDVGIVQINKDWHPDIREDQMLDPYFALDWMASEWSKGASESLGLLLFALRLDCFFLRQSKQVAFLTITALVRGVPQCWQLIVW